MNIGGPAIQAGLLTARLDPARFETLLVAGSEGVAEGNILRLGRLPSTVQPVVLPELGRRISPLDDLHALWKVLAIAGDYKPDIVHTHLAKAGFIGRLGGRLAGTRVVVPTYHGSVFRSYFGRRESAIYLGIERGSPGSPRESLPLRPGSEKSLGACSSRRETSSS
jgi:glycosyl transferase family 4